MQNETKGHGAGPGPALCEPRKGGGDGGGRPPGRARDILAEQMSDDADVRKSLRALAMRTGVLESKNTGEEDSVYATYYDFSQEARNLPAHRVLAMNRGEREGFLKVSLRLSDAACVDVLEKAFVRPGSVTTEQVALAAQDAWDRLLQPSIEREIRADLTERASASAIQVFGKNLAPAAHGPSGQGPRHAGRGPRLPHGLQAGRGG